MARNSSGTHTLPSAAPNPVVSGTSITSTWANTTLGDLSTEITDSLSRSGKGGMTAPLRCADGTVAAPAHSYTSETGSGWFRHAAGELRLAILGVYRIAATALGITVNGNLGATGTLDVSGTATVASLTSYDRVNVYDGSAGKRVSIDAAAGQAADYTLTLPAAVPASTLPVTMTAAGVLSTGQLVNAQQNFGTPSAATDVAIKSYVDETTSAVTSQHANLTGTLVTSKTTFGVRFKPSSTNQMSVTGNITDSGEALNGGDVLFVVPSGYRPPIAQTHSVLWYDASAAANSRWKTAFLGIQTNGNVTFHVDGVAAATNVLANGDFVYVGSVAPWNV